MVAREPLKPRRLSLGSLSRPNTASAQASLRNCGSRLRPQLRLLRLTVRTPVVPFATPDCACHSNSTPNCAPPTVRLPPRLPATTSLRPTAHTKYIMRLQLATAQMFVLTHSTSRAGTLLTLPTEGASADAGLAARRTAGAPARDHAYLDSARPTAFFPRSYTL
jgi:hypothetical protein